MSEQVFKIKWLKLQEILEDLTGIQCHITLSTHSATEFITELSKPNNGETNVSAVIVTKINDERIAEIYLNAYEVKSLTMVINALAHEAAHINKGEAHDEEFNEECRWSRNYINREYFEQFNNGAKN